jgi:branched-chain amino acid transport system substrate-binding protein
MMRMTRLSLSAVMALTGVVLTACSSSPSASPEPSEVGSAVASVAPSTASSTGADVPELDLKVGTLVGLSGDLAAGGQPWEQSVKVATDDLNARLEAMGLGQQLKVTYIGAEDSQGNATSGIEAAKKLVEVDGAEVVVGDFFSSVTLATGESVFIPNEVLNFTGGTSPDITSLNEKTGSTWIWRMTPPDNIQGPTLAKLVAQELGPDATLNIGARNDAYGTAYAKAFADAWTAGGGKINENVLYNPNQPSFDGTAQSLASGDPDGWVIIDFCGTFAKLKGPLQRSGTWDPKRTFTGDAMLNCPAPGNAEQGMRGLIGDISSGESAAGYERVFKQYATPGTAFYGYNAQAFDAVYVAFLAALKAGSTDPTAIRDQLQAVTNDPGTSYTFEELDKAINDVLAGNDIHFQGASGPIELTAVGDPASARYQIWEATPDGDVTQGLFTP